MGTRIETCISAKSHLFGRLDRISRSEGSLSPVSPLPVDMVYADAKRRRCGVSRRRNADYGARTVQNICRGNGHAVSAKRPKNGAPRQQITECKAVATVAEF